VSESEDVAIETGRRLQLTRESVQSVWMSASSAPYPGTEQHQALQAALVDFYADDPCVLCVAVFGSLGRGDWRPDSDLDLDVVVGDAVRIDVEPELRRLAAAFEAIGERTALVMPAGSDSGDVVFESLMQLSIRYHPLATTKPAILSGLLVLGGRLSQADLEAAARANLRPESPPPLTRAVDECLHHAVSAEGALRAGRLWLAIELTHRARGFLMELFWRARGGVRPIHTFDATAPAKVQALLGTALPAYDPSSIRLAIDSVLDILEHDLEDFAGAGIRLTPEQSTVLRRLGQRIGADRPRLSEPLPLRDQQVVSIRTARPSDAPRLTPLLQAFGETYARTDGLAERIAACTGRETALLAEVDGSMVGFALVEVRTAIGDGGPRAELTDLFVLEAYRRRGIGRLLVSAAETHARARGAETLFLLTGTENDRAQAFYRAVGYSGYSLALRWSLAVETK